MSFLTVTVPAGATTAPKPTLSGFAASPSVLYDTGGVVTLAATVKNATSCLFSSTKSVAGLPATITCGSGKVSHPVTLPANIGTKDLSYGFTLAVAGSETVSKSVNVTVSASALTGVGSVVSDGEGHCALLMSGGVDCWGLNTSGELGNGKPGGGVYDRPQVVTGITNAVSMASQPGDGISDAYCAVLSTGGVDCWGDDTFGELGNGKTKEPANGGYDKPQAVKGITNAHSVASDGHYGFCAVLSTGGVQCWGDNGDGELGNGTLGGTDGIDGYDSPQAVKGIANAHSVASDGEGLGYCAVLTTGGIDCWGDNTYGQLGNGTLAGTDGNGGDDTPQVVAGITNAASVTSGSEFGYCALLTTGGIDCWGDNTYGQLGNGESGGTDGGSGYDTPQAVTGITSAVSVTSNAGGVDRPGGGGDAYCAVLSSGGVDCWGYDNNGTLGNGKLGGGPANGGYDKPQAVTGITNARSVTSDGLGYCAVLSTGKGVCWGSDIYGALGNGNRRGPDGDGGFDTPQAVIDITNVGSISDADAGAGYCALLTTSGVDCWGENSDGEVGNGISQGGTGPGYDTPQIVLTSS